MDTIKEEKQKSLGELQENTTKQVMELNKTIQDLKLEVEPIKKSQRETTWEIEIQEIEERISGSQDPKINGSETAELWGVLT